MNLSVFVLHLTGAFTIKRAELAVWHKEQHVVGRPRLAFHVFAKVVHSLIRSFETRLGMYSLSRRCAVVINFSIYRPGHLSTFND